MVDGADDLVPRQQPREKKPVKTRMVKGGVDGNSASKLKDPEVMALLRRAAGAVGLSVEELAELAVDCAAAAVPAGDQATERYSLQDLGQRMWTMVSEVSQKNRPKWFQKLAETQQVALVCTLRERGFSSAVIAQDFAIDPMDVQKTFNRWADRLGSQVVNVRLDTIVGQLQLAAERASEGASDKKDWSTFWRIQKDMVGCLQSLGIVDKAIHRVEVTHHYDDQAKAEVDAILDLERKKRKRIEEIKKADANVIDVIPDDMLPDQKQISMDEKYGEE